MCGRMNAFSDYKRWNCSGSIQHITSERDRPSDIAVSLVHLSGKYCTRAVGIRLEIEFF